MSAHDDAMPEDITDAEAFGPWDDDLYWLNQREADDYRHELDEDDDTWLDQDETFHEGRDGSEDGYLPGDPDFDYDDRIND